WVGCGKVGGPRGRGGGRAGGGCGSAGAGVGAVPVDAATLLEPRHRFPAGLRSRARADAAGRRRRCALREGDFSAHCAAGRRLARAGVPGPGSDLPRRRGGRRALAAYHQHSADARARPAAPDGEFPRLARQIVAAADSRHSGRDGVSDTARSRVWIGAAAAALLAVSGSAGDAAENSAGTAAVRPGLSASASIDVSQAAIGKTVGDYTLLDTAGQAVKLSRYRGKPLLVNFVYTGCFPV